MNRKSEQPETDSPYEIPEVKPKVPFRINFRRIRKNLKTGISITGMILLIGLTGIIIHFLYKELTDDGYIIEHVNLPQSLVEAGFSGPMLANRISYQLQKIIKVTRQQEYSKDYKSTESENDLAIELVGVGIPVRAIVDVIGNTIGVNRKKRIKADIYFSGTRVILVMKLSGEDPEQFETMNNADLDIPIKELVSKAAEVILKYTDDETLQRYYAYYKQHNEAGVELAKYRLQKYSGETRKEAVILAAMADSYIRLNKFEPAMVKFQEGLKKDSTVAGLYLARGTLYARQAKLDEALSDFYHAHQLLSPNDRRSTQLNIYNNLAVIYTYKKNADSAFHYYQKVLNIDPEYSTVYFNMAILYMQVEKDTVRFLEHIDKALSYGLSLGIIDSDVDIDPVRNLREYQDIRKKYTE
jgi:tetratricopeptide (TPR) repeat protein